MRRSPALSLFVVSALVFAVIGCKVKRPPPAEQRPGEATAEAEPGPSTPTVPAGDREALVAELTRLAGDIAESCKVTTTSIFECKDSSVDVRWRRTELRAGMGVVFAAYCQLLSDADRELATVAAARLKSLSYDSNMVEAGVNATALDCMLAVFDAVKEPWVESAVAEVMAKIAGRLDRADEVLARVDAIDPVWIRESVVRSAVEYSTIDRGFEIYARFAGSGPADLRAAAAIGLTRCARNDNDVERVCAQLPAEMTASVEVEVEVLAWFGNSCENGSNLALERVRARLDAGELTAGHITRLGALTGSSSTAEYRNRVADLLETVLHSNRAPDDARGYALDRLADISKQRALAAAKRYVAADSDQLRSAAQKLIPPPAEAPER